MLVFQLNEPYCQPFGNRRLMHCVNISSPHNPNNPNNPQAHNPNRPLPPSPHSPSDDSILDHSGTSHSADEVLGYESCGRIVSQETADFYEFVACNVVIAIISVVVVLLRSKRLEAIQARRLAARIGMVRQGLGIRR
jgi:hypothetical protein